MRQTPDNVLEIWFSTERRPHKVSQLKIVLDLKDPNRIGFTIFDGYNNVATGGITRHDGEFRGNCNPHVLAKADLFKICEALIQLSREEATTLH